ncbi:MAG: hypothetical protein D6713_07290 [Deltaproteobacteria bacterium]|nr:MAG: hypothetical protein D6713_07290 [Deltaproteobacteria bacterium]
MSTIRKTLILTHLLLVALLVTGCLVPRSRYDAKVKEAEELRRSYAEVSQERESLRKQLGEVEKTVDSLRSELEKTKKELEASREENAKLKETVAQLQDTYATTKISRETLINELLEKEKEYSGRIKKLTLENASLKTRIASLEKESESLKTALEAARRELAEKEKSIASLKEKVSLKEDEAGKLRAEVEDLRKRVHLLEGKVTRVQEEAGTLFPLVRARHEAIVATSETVSATYISPDAGLLFAEVPLDTALSDGGSLSDDFRNFLGKLADVAGKEEGVRLTVVPTGKTYTGKMEVLVSLKEEEEKFLRAIASHLEKNPALKKVLLVPGRQTILDRTGGKREIKTVVRVFLEMTGAR